MCRALSEMQETLSLQMKQECENKIHGQLINLFACQANDEYCIAHIQSDCQLVTTPLIYSHGEVTKKLNEVGFDICPRVALLGTYHSAFSLRPTVTESEESCIRKTTSILLEQNPHNMDQLELHFQCIAFTHFLHHGRGKTLLLTKLLTVMEMTQLAIDKQDLLDVMYVYKGYISEPVSVSREKI